MGGVPFPRKIRLPDDAYLNPEHVFHIVIHATPRKVPFQDQAIGDAVWATCLEATSRGAVHILAACLMPDHLHVVAKPATSSVTRWVNAFKSYSTTKAWMAGWNGVLWQPSFFDRRLRDQEEFDAAIAYVLRNPVAASLIDETDSWRWAYRAPAD